MGEWVHETDRFSLLLDFLKSVAELRGDEGGCLESVPPWERPGVGSGWWLSVGLGNNGPFCLVQICGLRRDLNPGPVAHGKNTPEADRFSFSC